MATLPEETSSAPTPPGVFVVGPHTEPLLDAVDTSTGLDLLGRGTSWRERPVDSSSADSRARATAKWIQGKTVYAVDDLAHFHLECIRVLVGEINVAQMTN